jgi:hypothetical protein
MKIIIRPEMYLHELFEEFDEHYPNLKIRIYFNGDEVKQSYRKTLMEFSSIRRPMSFVVNPDCTISQLEDDFFEYLGLQVAVFHVDCESCQLIKIGTNLSLAEFNNCRVSINRNDYELSS